MSRSGLLNLLKIYSDTAEAYVSNPDDFVRTFTVQITRVQSVTILKALVPFFISFFIKLAVPIIISSSVIIVKANMT